MQQRAQFTEGPGASAEDVATSTHTSAIMISGTLDAAAAAVHTGSRHLIIAPTTAYCTRWGAASPVELAPSILLLLLLPPIRLLVLPLLLLLVVVVIALHDVLLLAAGVRIIAGGGWAWPAATAPKRCCPARPDVSNDPVKCHGIHAAHSEDGQGVLPAEGYLALGSHKPDLPEQSLRPTQCITRVLGVTHFNTC